MRFRPTLAQWWPAGIALAFAAVTLAAGVHWGSTTAGGADSYGYVSEAGLLLNRQLTVVHDVIRQSPWPNAADTWAPLGYRASPHQADAIVPLYPPGLPMLMALFQWAGGFCAAFVVVPLCGALTVWLTFVLGQQIFGQPIVSLSAAVLVGTSPVFLYQLMNPMTDVPVTAAWALAAVLSIAGWPLAAGVASGVALLIRPNLAAAALALLGWLVITRAKPVRFVAGLAPWVVAAAAINASLYESPLVSGYGTLDELYSWSFWTTNVRQFSAWAFTTQTPIVLLAVLFIVVPRWFPPSRISHPRLFVVAIAAAVNLSYLFYLPFDAWWYLRFLLPIWPVMMVLTAAATGALVQRLPGAAPAVALCLTVAALSANGLRVARERFAFDIGRAERRYIDVARFVESHTDARAAVFALQHSGTIRMYAGRLTLRFDQLDPAWFDRAVAFLQSSGRHPYIVLQDDERQLFVRRFGASAAAMLARPPFAEFSGGQVVVYDPANQGGGTPLAIAAAASRRTGWRCDEPRVWPPPLRME